MHAEYQVLSISAAPNGPIRFQVMTDDRHTPAWFDSAMFTTIDSSLPPNWVVRVGESGALDLAPARWLMPGFWEAFFDRNPEAGAVFDEEMLLLTTSPPPRDTIG
jgi:hypothetical protein